MCKKVSSTNVLIENHWDPVSFEILYHWGKFQWLITLFFDWKYHGHIILWEIYFEKKIIKPKEMKEKTNNSESQKSTNNVKKECYLDVQDSIILR